MSIRIQDKSRSWHLGKRFEKMLGTLGKGLSQKVMSGHWQRGGDLAKGNSESSAIICYFALKSLVFLWLGA
jgi:hypothetical protein